MLVTKNWKGRSMPYIFARFQEGFVLQPQSNAIEWTFTSASAVCRESKRAIRDKAVDLLQHMASTTDNAEQGVLAAALWTAADERVAGYCGCSGQVMW